ncbi:MAG: glutamine--fructose-6-phosphate transaminase (isomerizing) [Nanoarchaeota archaeon]|nr:glutamine--fructose-6-phosphate transaminase (isomerizing) [Nanoarchaeota archaeon]
MCGIIGYIGEKEVKPLLIEGLKRLEYRGYDSSGICVKNNSGLSIVKNVGKVEKLEKDARLSSIKGKVGIAHTRWATHGEPSELNAHPHYDCKNELAVVHNGIIENYVPLKKMLEKEGHKFKSQTDSEVIAHLLEKFYRGNLAEALLKVLPLLQGTYGLAVISKKNEEIVIAKKGSPLVLGIGNNKMLFASDQTALINYVPNIAYLNDNEIAILKENSFEIRNSNGKIIKPKIEALKLDAEDIEKNGFEHYMLKEIFEQPKSIKRALSGRLNKDGVKLSIDINLKKINRIVLLGCGTSWHSALIGKYLIEDLTNIPVEVDYASEFRYRTNPLKSSDLVIALSQSGETADTLAAIKKAKESKAKTIGLVNAVGSSIARECQSVIYLQAGPEIGVASTKAFTSQVTTLLLLALYIRKEKGMKLDKKLLKEILTLPKKVFSSLQTENKIKELADKFKDNKNFIFLGKGVNFPIALEGALKLKEISYIHAEGYPSAEMKHGPIALVDENMHCLFICTHDHTYDKVLSNIEEVKARKGKIIVITDKADDKLTSKADEIIYVPHIDPILAPLINIIPLQLFAYHVANMKGLDVDKPRNLAKSVTVE